MFNNCCILAFKFNQDFNCYTQLRVYRYFVIFDFDKIIIF